MKILVIGRSGQVARALRDADVSDGIDVVAVGRPICDLHDPASIESAILRERPDIVVNAAAYTQVDRAESDEAGAFAVNATGAGHVAKACAARDVPLIHLSTDYVFDGRSERPYCETDPTGPINAYGRSKLAGEHAVARLCPRHLIVRTSWVYSPWGSNFLLTMLRLSQDRPTIAVVDDQHGCPTYAPHLAAALFVMSERVSRHPNDVRWGVYHAAGQGGTTWYGFAREVFRHMTGDGMPSPIVKPTDTLNYPTPARRPAYSRLDCTALLDQFATVLPVWQTGVEICVGLVEKDKHEDEYGRGAG